MKESLVQFLRSTNLVSSPTADRIASVFEHREIEKNDLFLREGRVSNEYLFLEKGFMRAYVYDVEGNDVTTNFYPPLQVVFEVSSFFTRTPSKENIQALEESSGWCISYEQLNNLFHNLPEFREFGRHILVKGFSAFKSRTLSMITETAEQRYEHLLTASPQVFQHAPLKFIASYLGITDSSLSRIRKEITKK